MKSDALGPAMVLVGSWLLAVALAWATLAATPSAVAALPQSTGLQDASLQGGPGQGNEQGQRMPLFGKITAIHDSSLQVMDTNGENVIVKLSGQTEFRKDRQAAKRSDFKVGDIIIVRGEENADHSWTAQIVAARSTNGPGGPGGRGGPGGGGGGRFAQAGTLGKDFVAGEIKSIDAPKLSVLRSDNVTQSLELNEETSLRKGRDSITMADIQVGDHLFARGAEENGVFVPKTVVVMGPEQWKRMQEMGAQAGGEGGRQRRQQNGGGGNGNASAPAAPVAPATPPTPDSPPPAPNPPGPQH